MKKKKHATADPLQNPATKSSPLKNGGKRNTIRLPFGECLFSGGELLVSGRATAF